MTMIYTLYSDLINIVIAGYSSRHFLQIIYFIISRICDNYLPIAIQNIGKVSSIPFFIWSVCTDIYNTCATK